MAGAAAVGTPMHDTLAEELQAETTLETVAAYLGIRRSSGTSPVVSPPPRRRSARVARGPAVRLTVVPTRG